MRVAFNAHSRMRDYDGAYAVNRAALTRICSCRCVEPTNRTDCGCRHHCGPRGGPIGACCCGAAGCRTGPA